MSENPENGESIIFAFFGTDTHQHLLSSMAEYYARQPWAQALILFGSVARGDWDALSDLDLDVVIADGTRLDPVEEVARLCAAIGEEPALIAPRRGDDADVVLASMTQFSIRYHPLSATSPNILGGMVRVWGRISIEEIRAAGLSNAPRRAGVAVGVKLALAVKKLLDAQVAYARGSYWSALELLGEVRGQLLAMFAEAYDFERPLPYFDRLSDPLMYPALAELATELTPAAIRIALLSACDLLQGDVGVEFAAGIATLTPGESAILQEIRRRLE